MTPYFSYDEAIGTVVEFNRENWADVGIQIVTEAPLSVTPGFWERTDESGRKGFTFRANTDFGPFDENGLWHPPVLIRAVKDQYELEYLDDTALPYIVIKNTSNVWYLGSSGTIGDLSERLTLVDRLVPGNRLQVGSRTTTSAYLVLEFINGQIIRTEAGRYGGFIATIKDDGLAEGKALLWLDVRNTVQEVRDSPRRAARMLIYKTAGDALDSALGVPGDVGYVSTTPGGVVSKQLATWGEQAYQRGVSTPGISIDAAANFDFFNDGSVVVENRADAFTLRDESGRISIVSSGSARFIPSHGAMQGQPVPPLTATSVWEAPAPGAWQIAPGPGSTVGTALPEISVTNQVPAALDWSSVVVRLDGVAITPWLQQQLDYDLSILALQGKVPGTARLSTGEHTLTISGNTLRGESVEHSVAFLVALPDDTSGHAVARPYATGVWLSWMPPEGGGDFRIYRAADADGPYTLLNEAAPLQQPGLFDNAPLPESHYRIEGAYPSGDPMPPLEVSTTWSLVSPPAPAPESVTRLRVERQGDALEVLFDHSNTSTTRWRLERSIDGGATFQSLVPATEQTVVSGFRDRAVPPGISAEYRITPLSADGLEEGVAESVTATLPVHPDAPSGLTVRKTPAGALLQWDVYSDRRAGAFRVYRNFGSGFQILSTFGLGTLEYTDAGSGNGPVQYYMTAVGEQSESDPTAAHGLALHPAADEAAEIRMTEFEIWTPEGDGAVVVKVERSGNLSESAMVHYTTDGPTGGSALAGEDYIPVSGTLWFAPEQSEGEIRVELLPDAENNWPNDQTFFVWLDMNDGVFGPSTLIPIASSTTVRITESDVLFFPDRDLGKQVYRSDGLADIVVQRAYPSDRDISVAVIVDPDNPGNSMPDVDWVDTRPWRVSFEPGHPTAVLTLALPEIGMSDAVLNLQLEDPQGGASLNGIVETLTLTILDDAPPPRASVEVTGMAHRPAHGAAPGQTGCIDIDFANYGEVGTTGELTLEFMPPLGFGFPAGYSLNELVSSNLDMECYFLSDPSSDPTVTCTSMTRLAVGQPASASVALEAGWWGLDEVPFYAAVGDLSRAPPDLAVCADDGTRAGCGTLMIPVLEHLFADGFEIAARTAAGILDSHEYLMASGFEPSGPACLQ